MSRTPLQTVTPPLLLRAGAKTPDGECAVFTGNGRVVLVKVRIISPDALKLRIESDTRSRLSRALKGLSRLRSAYASQDTRALLAAVEQSRPLIPEIPFGTVTEDWPGQKMWGGARWHYAEAMSHAVKNARWVVWWPFSGEHEPSPGVYCPDMSTAVAMALFLDSLRICPRCGSPFVRQQDNIAYCKPACGAAHRTARSRERAKQRADEAKKPRKAGTR